MRRWHDLAATDTAPFSHQIAESIVVQIGPVGARAFLLEVDAVGDKLRPAGGFRKQLRLAGLFQLDRGPHRLLDAAAGGDDAVIAQDQRGVCAEAARHRLAALLIDDEIGGLRKNRQPAFGEIAAGVADGDQRRAERGKRHRMHGMAVDDALHVGPRAQDLGMDKDLVVARHRAVDFVALDVDRDDVVGPHLLDADAGGLHQEAPGIAGKPHRYVPGDVIAVAFHRQHAPGVGERRTR